MKYLKEFIEDDGATIDALAVELFHLGYGDFKDLLNLMAMHSGLEKLEYMDQVSKDAIENYHNLEGFRDAAGETT